MFNFGDIRSVTPEIARLQLHLFGRDAKISISDQISQQQLDQALSPFSISSNMYGDYKTDISFVVAQETLLR